jgi:hypothetical protein
MKYQKSDYLLMVLALNYDLLGEDLSPFVADGCPDAAGVVGPH